MLTMAPTKDKLRDERRRAALTQGELANKSGVGITAITRIESGRIVENKVF